MQITNFNITEENLYKIAAGKGGDFSKIFESLVERKFSIGDTGIPRNILQHWQTEKLLPYEYNEEGWTRFSLVEFIWLRCMAEMRSLSMSQQKIRIVKDNCFGQLPDELKNFFIEAIENFVGELPNKEEILSVFKSAKLTDDIWKQIIEQYQLSYFNILILQIIVYDHNVCLTLDKDDNFRLVILSEPHQLQKKVNDEIAQFLMNTSFNLINLRKIIREFFFNNSIKYDNDYIISFLKPKERKIVERIKKGNIKKMTVRFGKNNEPTHLEFTESEIDDKEINRAARLLKQGEYSDITIRQKDGKIVHFEKNEIIKL